MNYGPEHFHDDNSPVKEIIRREERLAIMAKLPPPPEPEPPPQPATPFDYDGPIFTLDEILAAVVAETGIHAHDLRGPYRLHLVGRAKFLFYFIARYRSGKSFPEIGRFIGKHYTTVLHGVRVVEKIYPAFSGAINRITARLEGA